MANNKRTYIQITQLAHHHHHRRCRRQSHLTDTYIDNATEKKLWCSNYSSYKIYISSRTPPTHTKLLFVISTRTVTDTCTCTCTCKGFNVRLSFRVSLSNASFHKSERQTPMCRQKQHQEDHE